MKTKIILLLLFSASFLFAQNSDITIKQITNVDGDARNVFVTKDSYFSRIFFELHKNNLSNIYSTQYNLSNDEFIDFTKITNDSSLNINPVYFHDTYFTEYLFFQTNRNGNWDITYKTNKDSVWGVTKFVTNSLDDEINPKVFFNEAFRGTDSVRVLYQKDNSIYLAILRDSVFVSEIIFEGSDSIKYSNPAGFWPFIVAKKTTNNDKSKIVFKKNDNTWSGEVTAVDSGHPDNPKFLDIGYGNALAYDNSFSGFNNIYLMFDWDGQKTSERFRDSIKGNFFDLQTDNSYIVTKRNPLLKLNNYDLYQPHTFKYLNDDSLLISTNKYRVPYYPYYSGPIRDTLIYTRVKNTSLGVASFGFDYDGQIFYTIWEDSVDGHIQLFGNKLTYVVGAVDEPEIPNNFYLFQNYPNPFNPITKIEFYLIHGSFTKLIIYNSLGEKVKELINNYLPSGKHEINFNASSFASGVYFYQLKTNPVGGQAGNFIQTRKMILLR